MVATTPAIPRERWHTRLELSIVIPGFLLAALMLWSVARSLIDANWTSGLEMIMGLVLPALVVGTIFARLTWLPGWLAHLLAGALGVAWTVERVGPLLVAQVTEEFGPGLAGRLSSWGEYASEILLRGLIWLRILQAGGRGEDIVLFIVTVSAMMWLLGYATGWLVFRAQRTWLAVTMSATIILINYTFTFPKPTQLFFIFLGAAMLLMVFQHVAQQQQLWRAALIEFPSWMLWRAVLAAAVFCLVLVLATGLIPGTVSNAEAQRAWRVLKSPFSSLRESWQDARRARGRAAHPRGRDRDADPLDHLRVLARGGVRQVHRAQLAEHRRRAGARDPQRGDRRAGAQLCAAGRADRPGRAAVAPADHPDGHAHPGAHRWAADGLRAVCGGGRAGAHPAWGADRPDRRAAPELYGDRVGGGRCPA
jgi:hypothetical protein